MASNDSIEISLSDKDLSSLGANIDDSEIDRLLSDTKDLQSTESHKPINNDSHEDDINPSLNETQTQSDRVLSKTNISEESEDHISTIKEEIEMAEESITGESINPDDNFDSIISLNMIQILEDRINEIQEIAIASGSGSQESTNSIQTKVVLNEGLDSSSLRELAPSERDSCTTTSTEYRMIQEDFGTKIFDFHAEITERDSLIEKLTNSLQKSMDNRQELQQQSDKLTNEVQLLRKQLTETLDAIRTPFRQSECTEQKLSEITLDLVNESDEELSENDENLLSESNRNLEEHEFEPKIQLNDPELFSGSAEIMEFQKSLNSDELKIFFEIQKKFDNFLFEEIEKSKMISNFEIKQLEEQLKIEKHEKESEINRLRQLLTNVKDGSTELTELRQELEIIHSREMENLRTYFERKCADLEKHYSEEVFSQKSQRNSHESSSDISDQEDFSHEILLRSKENSPKKRTREELYASPTHRQMTPTTFCDNEKTTLQLFDDRKNSEKEPNISVEELKMFYQEKIHDIKRKHNEELKKLNDQLKRFETKYPDDEFMKTPSTEIAEGTSSYIIIDEDEAINESQEIREIEAEYKRRLQEQVTLAKKDILLELEIQIQALLSSESNTDDDYWPPELILLREKFTEKSQLEIAELKAKHEEEKSRLKRENKNAQLIIERDNLRKLSNTLHWLLCELAKCVSICEDDLNNTLLEELQKHGIYQKSNKTEQDETVLDSSVLNVSTQSDVVQLQTTISKKSHFIPDVTGLLFIIEDPSLIEYINNFDLESFNLNDCLEKLKNEANHLLKLSENLYKKGMHDESALTVPDNSCEDEDGLKTGFPHKFLRASSFNENVLREKQQSTNQILSSLPTDINRLELSTLREQLDLQQEDFNEGYGQLKSSPRLDIHKAETSFSQLQEKARNFLSTPTKSMTENSNLLLQLIEDFCRESDKVVENGKKDRDDLQSQIDAADKQLKATRQFLEDQAAERELERDDFITEIERLKNLIRDKEKERNSFENASKEITKIIKIRRTAEQMESQIKDLTQQIAEYESKKMKFEIELKASIDKIFVLREIISELETKVETKELNEHVLNEKVKELEQYISSQNHSNETLQHEVDSLKSEIDHGYQEKISFLEEKLRNSRTSAEQSLLFGQIIEQLRDIENTLEQKTKTLESLHQTVGSNSCSTNPSEDVSVQGKISSLNLVQSPKREISLPINEIQRVLDKLDKHTRVEEAAIKRIRDLEMRVVNIRTTNAELQNERDILQERMSDQVLRISTLQSKLDEQRHRAEELQRNGTSDLTIRIHDLQNEIFNLTETLSARDKQILNLKNHLEQSKTIIDRQEAELAVDIQCDRSTIEKLENDLKSKNEENRKLKEKIKNEMINKLALPDLMETMLADKNEEIDHLKEQLESKEKELQGILEINLSQINNSPKNNKNQPDEKLSGRTLSDIVSISEYDEPDIIRRGVVEQETPLTLPQDQRFQEHGTDFSKCATANLTEKRIEDLTFGFGALNPVNTFDHPNYFQDGSIPKQGSTITPSCLPRQINFSELIDESKLKHSTPIIEEITENTDNNVISLKKQLEIVQKNSDSLKTAFENLEKEKNSEIDQLKFDLAAKIKLYDEIIIERKSLESQLNDVTNQILKYEKIENQLNEKQIELTKLEKDCTQNCSQINQLETQLNEKINEIQEFKSKINKLSNDNISLSMKISNQMNTVQKVENFAQQIEVLNKIIKEKDEILTKYEKNIRNYEKNEEINIEKISKLEIRLEKFENDQEIIVQLSNELLSVRTELAEKVLLYEKNLLDISSYKKEINQLKELVQNQDNNENLLELKQKLELEIEQRRSFEQQNQILKIELEKLHSKSNDNSKRFSLDEITEQVEKELNYSAQLDSNILKAIESEEENNFDTKYKTDYDKIAEKNLIHELQMIKVQLEEEQQNSNKIQKLLNDEKQYSQNIQQQDADIIEAMRLRLEAALENEQELHRNLDEEREKCERLTTQITNLQISEARKLKSPLNSPRRSPRSTNDFETNLIERLKSEIKLLTSQIERERERFVDLQSVLEKEKQRFKTELKDHIDYGEKLKHEMEKLSYQKNMADQEIEHLEERVSLASGEIESLEHRIATLQETETRRVYRHGRERIETTQTVVEMQKLTLKITNLEAEIEHLNKTISMLRDDIERSAQREMKLTKALAANTDRDEKIPDQFLQKIQEMNYLLHENTKESRQMGETLQYLIEERKSLQKKCHELEMGSQKGGVRTAPATTHLVAELEAKASHLFGKYLKTESHRKALVHQKRYLLIVLQTYQENETKAMNLINGNELIKPKKKSFKYVALAVIAIQRMKFIVKRWQSNKKSLPNSIFHLTSSKRTTALTTTVNNSSRPHDHVSSSPPCQDRSQTGRMNFLDNNLRPLEAPSLIADYSEKHDWNDRWKNFVNPII